MTTSMLYIKTCLTTVLVLSAIALNVQNVGVGTDSPTGKLTILGDQRNALTIKTTNNSKDVGISFQNY